jgi:aspartate/methionine/tyrosine aminotransferase
LLDAFFAAHAESFRWVRPRAGSVGFPRLTAPGVTIDDFAAGLVETKGVLLLPGSRFGHPGNHFRIGFGRTDMPEALEWMAVYAGARFRLT